MTSLASTTLSDNHKNPGSEDTPLAAANTTKFPSILSVSDLESQYDSIVNDDTVFDNENQQQSSDQNAGGPAWNSSKAQWKMDKPIIMIRSAFKSYGSKKEPKVVLQKLNMTIREGSM